MTVTLMDLGGEARMSELAGVLYPESGSLPIGGFVVVAEEGDGVAGPEGITNQLMAVDYSMGWRGWPTSSAWLPLSDEPLQVAPGEYFLVLWGDDRLAGFAPWAPAERDGSDLVGCVHPVRVTDDPATPVVFEVDPFTPGVFGVCAPVPIPVRQPKQGLYGDGDINCDGPYHVADDESLPVGSVEFRPSESEIVVVVELTGAAPSMSYRVEIWSPELCYQIPWWGHFSPVGEARLATDEAGSGQVEFVVGDVDPGVYRLNVNVVAARNEEDWPEGVDPELREIGGTGFSVAQVPSG